MEIGELHLGDSWEIGVSFHQEAISRSRLAESDIDDAHWIFPSY